MERITPFSLALRNVVLRPFRTMASILTVAFAVGLLCAGTLVLRGVEEGISAGMGRLGADIMVVPGDHMAAAKSLFISGEPTTFYMPGSVEGVIRAIDGVDAVSSQVFVVSAPAGCCDIPGTTIIGFDPDTDFTLSPWISGFSLAAIQPGEAITGHNLPFVPGQEIRLYGTRYRVRAGLDRTGSPLIDRSIFLALRDVEKLVAGSRASKGAVRPINLPEESISAVLVKVAKGALPQKTGILIEANVPRTKAVLAEDMLFSVKQRVALITGVLLVLMVFLWLLVILNLGLAFSSRSRERRRETGLLRAMGASRGFIARETIHESLVETAIGGVMGVCMAWTAIFLLNAFLLDPLNVPNAVPQLPFALTVSLLSFLAALLAGVGASLIPALKNASIEPYEAVRGGEL